MWRRVTSLFSGSGTWTFHPVPGRPNLLLQGNYYGLSVLELKAGKWSLRNSVEGFDYSARFVVALRKREVYISHEYRGVYGLKLDAGYRKVVEEKLYREPLKGKNAGLVGFQDSIFYYSREGIFVLQNFEDGFVRSEVLTESLKPENYVSGKMMEENQQLWFFTRESINRFQRGALSRELSLKSIPVAADLINAKSGYENITHISEDTFLLGVADGYLLLALSSVPLHEHEVFFKQAQAVSPNAPPIDLPLAAGGDIPAMAHNMHFRSPWIFPNLPREAIPWKYVHFWGIMLRKTYLATLFGYSDPGTPPGWPLYFIYWVEGCLFTFSTGRIPGIIAEKPEFNTRKANGA